MSYWVKLLDIRTCDERIMAGTAIADRRILVIYATKANIADSTHPPIASSLHGLARGIQRRPGHLDVDR